MLVQKWKKILRKHFPDLAEAAEIGASVACQLFVKDITNPVWFIFLEVQGSGKTILVNFFSLLDDLVVAQDDFTSASLISHASNRTKEDLKSIDLLPKLKDKILLVRDFTALFSKGDEELRPQLAKLTRALDGQGLKTSSGVHGERGFTGKLIFMIIGASTPITSRVWKLMSQLGSRILTLHLNLKEDDDLELAGQNMSGVSIEEKEEICRVATKKLINQIRDKGKVTWNLQKEDESLFIAIAKVARLTSYLRSYINEDKIPLIENPRRLNRMLYNLAKGHAVLFSRNYITKEDMPVVLKVALSTASMQRAKIINKLLKNEGRVSTGEIMDRLNCSRPIAIRYMKEFKYLGIAKLKKVCGSAGRPEFILKLKEEHSWFISKEFKDLFHAQD